MLIRLLIVLLLALALVVASFGIYAFARHDVQRGANAAGVVLLIGAVVAAALAFAAHVARRRRA